MQGNRIRVMQSQCGLALHRRVGGTGPNRPRLGTVEVVPGNRRGDPFPGPRRASLGFASPRGRRRAVVGERSSASGRPRVERDVPGGWSKDPRLRPVPVRGVRVPVRPDVAGVGTWFPTAWSDASRAATPGGAESVEPLHPAIAMPADGAAPSRSASGAPAHRSGWIRTQRGVAHADPVMGWLAVTWRSGRGSMPNLRPWAARPPLDRHGPTDRRVRGRQRRPAIQDNCAKVASAPPERRGSTPAFGTGPLPSIQASNCSTVYHPQRAASWSMGLSQKTTG